MHDFDPDTEHQPRPGRSSTSQRRYNNVTSDAGMNVADVDITEYGVLNKGEAEADSDSTHEPKGASFGWVLFQETVQIVVPALLLALVIHLFFAQATVVYGRSMEPNLIESQRLIIDKISYRFRLPQRNDIVVLDLPTMDELLVKRIVGLPGETVAIRDGDVYIDGIRLDEAFPHHVLSQDMESLTLSPLSYFVLGDNRENSNDSRAFGSVKREHILGRVWLRYWPFQQITRF